MVDYPDIHNFTRDELIEEFCKLFDRFQELRESNEVDTQKIHELKRSLDTATAAQVYLSQELEHYTNSDTSQEEKQLQKTISDLGELKRKYGKLEESFRGLQQDYNTVLDENSLLTHTLEEAAKRKDSAPVVVDHRISEDDLQRIQMLELENIELLEKIEEFEERTVCYTLTIGEFEKNIEILRDQINCLEENLQSKKEDLEEKLQILESTQEQLAEANSKIAMLSNAPEADDRKGNSLFAEVDDQRQAMRKLLAAQKQNYVQMKKIYNESEHEIRRLKRENISMHTELEACSSIFCNADKVYQDKLKERIRLLSNQNEDLELKLIWTQERIKEMASDKGVSWLDSMFSLCKKETDDLKKQLHSVRIQNSSLEEQLRNTQQDIIRWRFESLKSRCILLDREQLLTVNNITFKPVQAVEFRITEKQQNEARPRIVSIRRSSTFDNIQRRSLTSLNVVKDETANSVQEQEVGSLTSLDIVKVENAISVQEQDVVNQEIHKECAQEQDKCEENLKSLVDKTTPETNNIEIVNDASENISKLKNCLDDEENKKETPDADDNKITSKSFHIYTDEQTEYKDISIKSKFSKITANPPSPMRPSQRFAKMTQYEGPSTPPARSILTKQNDYFSKQACKAVKFSSKEDLIHQLSPNLPSSSTLTCNKNVRAGTASATPTAKNSKAVVKEYRTKSNIVVRRIVIGSKHD